MEVHAHKPSRKLNIAEVTDRWLLSIVHFDIP